MVETFFGLIYTFVTVVLLVTVLKKTLQENLIQRNHILLWFFFGAIFSAFSFSWLYTAYPIAWMKGGLLQLAGIVALHSMIMMISGICYAGIGYGLYLQKIKKVRLHLRPFLFGVSLMVTEIIRAIFISILYLGEKTTIDINFGASTLGSALAPTPFVEYAYIGGAFTLSFILGYLVYCIASKQYFFIFWKHLIALSLLLLVIHYMVPIYGPTSGTTVGVITTNFITPKDKDLETSFKEGNKKLHAMTESFKNDTPDIIVYPEDSRYLDYLPKDTRKELSRSFPDTLFIDGETVRFYEKLANVSLFYTSEDAKELRRGKSFLFPFNEYIPFMFLKIFTLFIPQEDIRTYTQNHSYIPIESAKTISFHNNTIATLLCYEIVSWRTLDDIRKEKPSLIFFQSHLNVFHDNVWFNAHLYLYSKTAAAQVRRPIISAVNGAPSFMISPYGYVVQKINTGFSTSTLIFR